MSCRWIYSVAVVLLLLFDPGLAHANTLGLAHVNTDVERGAKAAQKFCARCHVVGRNEYVGIGSTMSFFMMSENIERYTPRLLTVTERWPHIALKLDLKEKNINDLIVYIKQLDWKARWKRIRPKRR
jgi:cytochrome c553